MRKGVDMAMRLMGEQFVTGETIGEALRARARREAEGFRYSYDMLGEAALTEADAQRYLRRVRAGDRGDRRGVGRARHLRRAGHLDQAVGAASALQPRAARARASTSCIRACASSPAGAQRTTSA